MRRFLAVFGLAALASAGIAADADHDLILKVKSAIAADANLRDLNLMVSVQDGVAVVGGAVPNFAANELLTKAVTAVPGISAVRVNCWVPATQDPLAAAVKSKLKTPADTPPTMPVVQAPLRPETTVNAATTGYSPVPPPAPPAPAGPQQFPTIPSPRVPTAPSQDVAEAVEAVRKSESRFRGLTVSLDAGAVTIAGTAHDGADAWDLAAAVRKVPGVTKVVVGKTAVR